MHSPADHEYLRPRKQTMVMNTCSLQPVEAVPETGVRTLIVDDSPFMLKLLAQTLEEAGGFELVGSATDAYKALHLVAALSPELVLMDVHMPGLNGIQAARFMKQSENPPVVILVSSRNSSMTTAFVEQAAADGFVRKDGNFKEHLIRVLRSFFGAGDVPGNIYSTGVKYETK